VAVNQYLTFCPASSFIHSNAFVPEQFLANSPFSSDRLDVLEPFLLGRHKCIGQKLAWMIMRLSIARLIYSFDLQAVEELRDFGEQKTYIFWNKQSLRTELQLRHAQ
jgi:cytochrome P450